MIFQNSHWIFMKIGTELWSINEMNSICATVPNIEPRSFGAEQWQITRSFVRTPDFVDNSPTAALNLNKILIIL